MPRRFNGGPSLPAHTHDAVLTHARRTEGWWVYVWCLLRVQGGSKYCVNSHGRKCMGRVTSIPEGEGCRLCGVSPITPTIIRRGLRFGDQDARFIARRESPLEVSFHRPTVRFALRWPPFIRTATPQSASIWASATPPLIR